MDRYNNAERVALVYRFYEDEFRRLNALDFNSFIFETYRLMYLSGNRGSIQAVPSILADR